MEPRCPQAGPPSCPQLTLTFMAKDFLLSPLWSLPRSESSSLSTFSVGTVAMAESSSSSPASLPAMGSFSGTSLSEELAG